METEITVPQSLQEAIKHYSDPEVCHDFLTSLRWPNGVACPHCGCMEPKFIATRRIWRCTGCKQQFSVRVGTVLEDSPLKLEIWLAGMWLIANAKNGISSCEIARSLGITQKSAWFLLHRIRHVMQTGSLDKMTGIVECDETFIGGKEANKHKDKKLNAGRGTVGKEIVMGILERSEECSQVVAKVVPDTSKETL